MPDKCCVFNCRSNYDNGPKETVFFFPDEKKDFHLDSFELDLWTEKAENRRRNHAYVESILNRIITKQGLKENDIG